MRTQDEKLRISIVVMVLSILLVIVMLLVQANPVKENLQENPQVQADLHHPCRISS